MKVLILILQLAISLSYCAHVRITDKFKIESSKFITLFNKPIQKSILEMTNSPNNHTRQNETDDKQKLLYKRKYLHNRTSYNLQDDLKEFTDLIPTEELFAIAIDYLSNDELVQEIYEYFSSDDFYEIVAKVDNLPDYKTLLNTIQKAGFDIYKLFNFIRMLLGFDELPKPKSFDVKDLEPGFPGLVHSMLSVLPLDKLANLYINKLITSHAFADFISLLRSNEIRRLVQSLRHTEYIDFIVYKCISYNVNVPSLFKWLNILFDWDLYPEL